MCIGWNPLTCLHVCTPGPNERADERAGWAAFVQRRSRQWRQGDREEAQGHGSRRPAISGGMTVMMENDNSDSGFQWNWNCFSSRPCALYAIISNCCIVYTYLFLSLDILVSSASSRSWPQQRDSKDKFRLREKSSRMSSTVPLPRSTNLTVTATF